MSENVSEPFYLNGDQVVSVESGEVVAVLRNGVPVMQAGKNPLGKRVKECKPVEVHHLHHLRLLRIHVRHHPVRPHGFCTGRHRRGL